MKLSIIIPAHNNTQYLKPLLEKLMKQKTDEVEIIVVEDGSSEDMSFIDTYDVVSIHHKERKLPSGARNIGLDLAKGEYIAFLDSDDDIVDDFIETHLKMADTGCDYCAYKFYIRSGDILTPGYIQDKKIWSYNVWSYLFKKSYIGDTRFDENREFNEDVDFLYRVIKDGKREELDKVMVYYNPDNLNSQSHKHHKLIESGEYVEN